MRGSCVPRGGHAGAGAREGQEDLCGGLSNPRKGCPCPLGTVYLHLGSTCRALLIGSGLPSVNPPRVVSGGAPVAVVGAGSRGGDTELRPSLVGCLGGTSDCLGLFRAGWAGPQDSAGAVPADPPRVVSLEEPELRLEHCIEFVVRGNPPPTLRWLHNGQPLRESRIIRVEYYQEGEVAEGCLLFNKPTHYNNGNYTLIARNPLGTANQTINGHFLKEPFPGVCVGGLLPSPPDQASGGRGGARPGPGTEPQCSAQSHTAGPPACTPVTAVNRAFSCTESSLPPQAVREGLLAPCTEGWSQPLRA